MKGQAGVDPKEADVTTAPSPTSIEQGVTDFLRRELARQGVPNPEDFQVVWELGSPLLPDPVPSADRDEAVRRLAQVLCLPMELVAPAPTESGKPGDRA